MLICLFNFIQLLVINFEMDYSVMYRPTERPGNVDPQVPPAELGRA